MKTAIFSLVLLLSASSAALGQSQPAPAAAPSSDDLQSRFAAGLAYLQQVDGDVREAVQQVVRVNQENAVRSEDIQIKADEIVLTKIAVLDPSLKDLVAERTKLIEQRKLSLAAQKKLLEQQKK